MSTVVAELSQYHAIDARAKQYEADMQYLVTLEKETLIERHDAQVSELKQDIEGWRIEAASLGAVIKRQKIKIDRLMMGVAFLAGLCLYFAVRAGRC